MGRLVIQAGDTWKGNVFWGGDWRENEEQERPVLKWRLIKLKAQEACGGRTIDSAPHGDGTLRPSREMQAALLCVVAKCSSWESPLREASHTWGLSVLWRERTFASETNCEEVTAFMKKWCSKHDSSASVITICQKFITGVYFFLVSMNPDPSAEFQFRNETVEFFFFYFIDYLWGGWNYWFHSHVFTTPHPFSSSPQSLLIHKKKV